MADGESSAPARIAYVDHAYETGGAERSLLDLMTRLDKRRFVPTLFCSEGAEWLLSEPPGISVVRAFAPSRVLKRKRDELRGSVLGGARDLLSSARPAWSLWSRFRRLRPHIVHTNTLKTHLLATPAARLSRARLVWHLRDILTKGPALDWLLRCARWARPTVIAISEAVCRSLPEGLLDVRVIHNGTDLSSFYPRPDREPLRESLGLREEEIAICIVGRLAPWKGHRELLRAFAEVAREAPTARLLVVGEIAFWEETYEGELRALAKQLGIGPRVQWLGFRRDVPEILSAADIFVLPSMDEPFGRVVIEAMACEKPVVATRSGGVPEIVVDGETGLLVAPREVGELATALARLARCPERRREMGQAGRRRAESLFDVNHTVRQIEALYDELLGG